MDSSGGPKVITAGGVGLTSAILRKKRKAASSKKKKAPGEEAPGARAAPLPAPPEVPPPSSKSPTAVEDVTEKAAVDAAASGEESKYGTPSSHPDEGPAEAMDLISLGELAAAASAQPPTAPQAAAAAVVTAGGAGARSGSRNEPDRSSSRRAQNRSDDDEATGGRSKFFGGGKKGGRRKDVGLYERVEGRDEEEGEEFCDDEKAADDGGGKRLAAAVSPDDLYAMAPPVPGKSDPSPSGSSTEAGQKSRTHDLLWLLFCFLGIMFSFVCYGLLLEYATSGGRKLHELSFLFVTSSLYTITAAAGRYVRDETPSTIPPARFAVLGMTSMGSTFFSVRSLRYVIYPIQVLAKSCKPVPVMIMGAFMGKKYPLKKYVNVFLIVAGVALFMGGGDSKKSGDGDGDNVGPGGSTQLLGIFLLFISLCFDGGTGAYEDKLMSVHSVGPFDLMYNIQLGKTILAGVGLLVLNQVHLFLQMCQEMGFVLVALGFTGAVGQVFIFVTIAKFGALTCSIIGLARKVTTLVASIYFYGHELNAVQGTGLVIAVGSMVMNFWGKKGSKSGGDGHDHGGGGGGHGHGEPASTHDRDERRKMLDGKHSNHETGSEGGEVMDIELGPVSKNGDRTTES